MSKHWIAFFQVAGTLKLELAQYREATHREDAMGWRLWDINLGKWVEERLNAMLKHV